MEGKKTREKIIKEKGRLIVSRNFDCRCPQLCDLRVGEVAGTTSVTLLK